MRPKAQGGPEFMVVVSFVLVIFLVVSFLSLEKQNEAQDLKLFLDAKSVVNTISDNINMISKNGDGYSRRFIIPETLFGNTDYEIFIAGNFVEISYADETWVSSILTNNVTVMKLEKGGSSKNCVSNERGEVIINTVCGVSDMACGSVQSCDPGDVDNCPTCDTPDPVELNENSRSYCVSYGCDSEEWHIYKVIPSRDGDLEISFRSNATMPEARQTDLIFYDYNATGCANPQTFFQMEPSYTETFAVQEGRTYIIGIDSDSSGCFEGGAYHLDTELI